ncbi:hypothetical protein B0H15DRAFT_957321 [Mycena belliarum]|uniref:Uncharacterized protein n=1 Tax=Mycena belliarum TaxID=1033014 RepID=A0AAD6XGV9_9AGAR|nr:hypothetical protein B0H15DRAFT_957321 [Mycena belliae]
MTRRKGYGAELPLQHVITHRTSRRVMTVIKTETRKEDAGPRSLAAPHPGPRAPPPFPPPASGPAKRAGRGTLRDTPATRYPPRLGPPRLCCALTARISPPAHPRRSRRPHPAQQSERGGARCATHPATRYPLVWARPASAARSPPSFPPPRAPAVPAARIRPSKASGAGHAARHTQLPATPLFGPAPPLLRAHRPDFPPRAPPPFPPPASGPAKRAGRGTLRDTPSYPLPPRLAPPRLCCALTALISPPARPRRSRRPHPAQQSERGGARCATHPATRYPLVWPRPASAARSPPSFPPPRAPAVPAARIRPSKASGAGHAARHTQLPATPSFGPAPPLLRAHRPHFPPRAPPPFLPPASGPAKR